MTHPLTRRSLLTAALGVGGLGLVVGAAGPAAAVPSSPTRRGRFVDVTAWPAQARVRSLSVGGSGTWAVGQQYTDSGTRSFAVLRRLSGKAWVGVKLPVSFRATGEAVVADATGVWVGGTRNDVSLPVPDGTSVVGHVSRTGAWRALDTTGLPAWLEIGSLRVEGGQLLLTGMVPTAGGASLRPYAASHPLAATAAASGWTSHLVDAPAWDGATAYPLLRVADGDPTWATAGAWVLRRAGAGWRVVDVPPGTEGLGKTAAALAQGRMHVVVEGAGGTQLWRQTAAGWTTVDLPPRFGIQAVAGSPDELWAVGTTTGGPDFGATAVRVVGGRLVDRVGGAVGSGGPVGILDQVVVDAGGALAAGYHAAAPGGDALGWTCRPVV